MRKIHGQGELMIYLLYDLMSVIYKDLASEANVSFAHTHRLHTKQSK
jgi:hypothetical protein